MAGEPESKAVPTQGGGSGPFVGIAVVLAFILGGLLFFKMKGDGDSPPPPASAPVKTASAPAKPALTDSLPPPPDDEPDAGVEDAGKAPTKVAHAGGGCSGGCSGSPSPGTRADIQGTAGSARSCYERALRNNAQLQGRMTVSLRVDPAGSVCSVSISNDSVGSPEVTNCVTSMFRGKRVSPPTGGCADISTTLNFQPKNK